jgi:hypothetical protein
VSDLIVVFGAPQPPDEAVRILRERPYLADRRLETHRFVWGCVTVQRPPGPGLEPLRKGERLACCVGRPTLRHGNGPARVLEQALIRLDPLKLDQAGTFACELSGMFVLAIADETGLCLVTDRLGSRPLYQVSDSRRRPRALGTFADAVAAAAGEMGDFDLASLAEIALDLRCTFPHTARRRVRQLDPGAIHAFRCRGPNPKAECLNYWRPVEPATPPSDDALIEQLVEAMRSAGHHETTGVGRVAVTLSGGLDSRAVLASIPRDRDLLAITYQSRPNREVATARAVAEAVGVRHAIAQRDHEFYSTLARRGPLLAGIENDPITHSLCVADAGLSDSFDLLVGGTLADALLKSEFAYGLLPPIPRRPAQGRMARWLARLGLRSTAWGGWRLLRPAILEAILERRRKRVAWIARDRPGSAQEWLHLYPVGSLGGHLLGNSRLFHAEPFFLHADIVDLAVQLPQHARENGRVAHRAYSILYGDLGKIVNANTGVAANLAAYQQERGRPAPPRRLPASDRPWEDVEGSWPNFQLLQRYSPDWRRERATLLDSGFRDVLAELFTVHPQRLLRGYCDELMPQENYRLIRLGLFLEPQLRDAK